MRTNNDSELKWKISNYQAYSQYLQSWEWQWFVTLTFWDDKKPDVVKKAFIKWIQRICIEESLQVGSFYGICFIEGHPHIHALLLARGKTSDGIKTLNDVNPTKWEKNWNQISKVEKIRSREDSARYLSKHFIKNKTFEVDFYNLKLLKKMKGFCGQK